MSRRLSRPFFPIPPPQYMQNYFVYLDQMQNPGDIRGTQLTLTELQTDDSGLETGALFQHNGFVKIAQLDTASVRGSGGTGQAGQVTVVIS